MSALEALRREVERAEEALKPLAKIRLNPRDELRSTARATFLYAVQTLKDQSWSQNAICDALGVDLKTFLDWCEGKRQLPAWAIAALPEAGRVSFLRSALGWPEARSK
jgi:hypothetical protein